MATMNISLPDDLKTLIEGRVTEGRYSNVSDYVRELIRKDLEERTLEQRLLEALQGNPPRPVTKETWERMEREGLRRLATLRPK
jgi:antitoxin ParD1/3/4